MALNNNSLKVGVG